jgi:hypothetical protein
VRASKKPAASASALRPSVAHGAVLARTALLAVLAIGGATWALVRHYTYQPPPLRVLRELRSPMAGDNAGDVPAPELLPVEDASH